MADLREGVRVRISGLVGRADLNEKTAKLLRLDEAAGRWECEVAGTKEGVRIKPANLTPLRQTPQARPAAEPVPAPPPSPPAKKQQKDEEDEEDEDCGVYVNAKLGGKDVAIDPKRLMQQFQAVVAKYKMKPHDAAVYAQFVSLLTTYDPETAVELALDVGACAVGLPRVLVEEVLLDQGFQC